MAGRRRLWPTLAAFALVGVLLGALAAFFVRDRSGDVVATATATATAAVPEATTRPRATPGVTVPVQAQPTDPSRASPTTAAEGKATSLATFGKHVSAAIKKGSSRLESLRTAAQAFDIPAVRSDAAALAAWAEAESAWLDAHPPKACYAKVHAAYGSAIDDFEEAATITEQFAADFPFADFDSLQQALDLAESGSASMQSAVDLLPAVRC